MLWQCQRTILLVSLLSDSVSWLAISRGSWWKSALEFARRRLRCATASAATGPTPLGWGLARWGHRLPPNDIMPTCEVALTEPRERSPFVAVPESIDVRACAIAHAR